MGVDLDSVQPAHPRLLRLVGDRDRGLRVWLAGMCLEAAARLRARSPVVAARPALVLSVDKTGAWLDCDRCGLASWPVDAAGLGEAWESWPVDAAGLGEAWELHLAHCSGGAS